MTQTRRARAGAPHMTLTPQPPNASAFAPFGAFLEPPTDVGGRKGFSRWLAPVPGLAQQCHLNRVAPTVLPVVLDQVERHPHAAQLFLPMGVSRYLVTVLPSDDAGAPDFTQAQAFLVPGTLAVVYQPGTWHAGIAVLDAEASFAVLMWRGADDDDVFAPIPAIEVQPAGLGADGGVHG